MAATIFAHIYAQNILGSSYTYRSSLLVCSGTTQTNDPGGGDGRSEERTGRINRVPTGS